MHTLTYFSWEALLRPCTNEEMIITGPQKLT